VQFRRVQSRANTHLQVCAAASAAGKGSSCSRVSHPSDLPGSNFVCDLVHTTLRSITQAPRHPASQTGYPTRGEHRLRGCSSRAEGGARKLSPPSASMSIPSQTHSQQTHRSQTRCRCPTSPALLKALPSRSIEFASFCATCRYQH
jgi:hypothetical protein